MTSLNKTVLRHTFIYSIAAILGKLTGLLLLPFYAHIFKTEGYGIIGLLDASLGILAILFGYGLNTAIIRFYHAQIESKKGLVISTAIWLCWGLSFILFPLPIIFSKDLSTLLFSTSSYYLIIILAILAFILDVSSQSSSTFLIIKQYSLVYSLLGFLRMFLQIGLNIWLVIILKIGLVGIFLSSFISALIMFLIFHTIVLKIYGLKFNSEIAKDIIRFQLPLMPAEFISFISRQAERFLVRYLVNLEGVGILEMAYKFPPLIGFLVTTPFNTAWRTKSFEIAEHAEAPKIIGKMFTNYFFITVFAGLMLAVNIEAILKIMTPSDFWNAIRISKIEIITTIFVASRDYMTFGLFYKKRTKTISIIRSSLAPIKILTSFLFIYYFGILGAAYSALIFEIITFFWITNKSQQSYHILMEYKKILSISILAILIFLVLSNLDHNKVKMIGLIEKEFFSPVLLCFGSKFASLSKSRKIIEILNTKQNYINSILSNSLFSLTFLLLVPLVYPEIFIQFWKKFKKIY